MGGWMDLDMGEDGGGRRERERRVSQMTRIAYETALFQIRRYFKGPTVESSLITKSKSRLFFTMNSPNHVFELLAMVHVPN